MSEKTVVAEGGLKTCTICKMDMPVDMFFRDRSRRDGREHRCKSCNVIRGRKYQRELYFKIKDTDDYREKRRRNEAAWRRRNPEKIRAHSVAKHLKLRANRCGKCGTTGGKLHGHHPDYSRPDFIITLCIPCHQAVHHG